MKRNYIVFIVVGMLLIAIGGTALAASSNENSAPSVPSDESYRQMYEACHGPNGYMTKGVEQSGGVSQNFGGMMKGINYSRMMGI